MTDHSDHHWLHALGLLAKQIVLNPLIMPACAGALAAAFHFHPPVVIDNMLLSLQNAAAPMALFVLGVVALRPFGRVPWEVPASVAVMIGTFASFVTLTAAMWLIQTGRLALP